jgi:arylsulfatase A-like enzyme
MNYTMTVFAALLLSIASSSPAAESAPAEAANRKPNILLLLADDLGYGELNCQGNAQIPTPHIDSLARSGIRFTSGYVSGPCCGPTRAGLLTGRYQQRFGFEFNLGASGEGLSLKETTIADRLRAIGYATGMFGKWHLGYSPNNRPTKRGFDWFYGFLPACRPYPCRPGEMGKSLLGGAAAAPTYTTEAFAAEAAAFIEQHRAEPWFVYLPFNAVHASPQGGKKLVPRDAGKYRERFPDIADDQRRIFAGMLAAMDDAVGSVLAKLQELQLEENTLIFFLSDNGGPTWQTTSRNDPLRGHKGDVLEGGIRVPFIVQWKGHLAAGRADDRPVIQLDVLPTALAAAGAPEDPRLDGVNLLPCLAAKSNEAPHDALFWRYGRKHAVRMDDWKLVDEGGGAELYNLAADIGESTDHASNEPGRVKKLQAAYDAWNAHNIPPRWGGEGKPGGKARNAAAADKNEEQP